jgi:hypothetical protein
MHHLPRTQVWHVESLSLDARATQHFWEERVDAYQQWVISVHPTGARLSYDAPQRMQRGQLLWHHFDWVFDHLLLGASRDQPHLTRLGRLEYAEQHLDADAVLDLYCQHVFAPLADGDPPRDAGLYGKDMRVPRSKFGDSLTAVGDTGDMLEPGGFVNVPGISRRLAWLYSGGHGLAAHHVEDGYMHFVNVMHDLQFDTSTLEPADGRLLRLMRAWCAKQWLFIDAAFTPGGLADLQQQLVRDMGLPASEWPVHLHTRACLLSPQYWLQHLPGGCKVMRQRPGQCILSNSSHSVIGMTLCSAAWNVALGDSLLHYHACQCVEALSTEPQSPFAPDVTRGEQVTFSCAQEVLRAHYHQAYESARPMRAAAAALARMAYVTERADRGGGMQWADDQCIPGMTFSASIAALRRLPACVCLSCGFPLVFSGCVLTSPDGSDAQALLCGRCARVLGAAQQPGSGLRCLMLLSPRECALHSDMPLH